MISSDPAFFCGRPVQSSVKMTSALLAQIGKRASRSRSAIWVRGASASAETARSSSATDRLERVSLGAVEGRDAVAIIRKANRVRRDPYYPKV